MATDYGIDANGMPVSDSYQQSQGLTPGNRTPAPSGGQNSQCPEGQTWDANQNKCIAVLQSNGGGLEPPPQNQTVPGQQPAAQPTPAGPTWDKNARNAFRDAWQSSNQDIQTFLSSNPTATPFASHIHANGDVLTIDPTVDDKYASMGPEKIDAVLDYGPGGANKHVWTGIGPGSADSGTGGAANGGPGAGAPAAGSTPHTIQSFLDWKKTNSQGSPFQYTPITPYQQTPYQVPEQRAATGELVNKLLSTTSLDDATVAKMKEAQKSTILQGANQLKQQQEQNAANRGVSMGGNLQAQNAATDYQALGDLSKSYRDTAIAKSAQDRIDQLNAVNASEGYQQQLLGEYLGLDQNKFNQYMGQNQLNLTSQQAQQAANEASANREFQTWAAEQGLNIDEASQLFTQWLGQQNFQLSQAKFLAGGQ